MEKRLNFVDNLGDWRSSDGGLNLFGSAKRKERDAYNDVMRNHPFPPANCNDGAYHLQLLLAEKKASQSGNTNLSDKRYIKAYDQIIPLFQNWMQESGCTAMSIATSGSQAPASNGDGLATPTGPLAGTAGAVTPGKEGKNPLSTTKIVLIAASALALIIGIIYVSRSKKTSG